MQPAGSGFRGNWKRSQSVLKICAAARFDKDLFHMLSTLGSILKIPTREVNQG